MRPYSIDIYDKDSMSKIELTQNLVESLPKPENKGYVLCDSWYSCKAIFNSSVKAGYSYIVTLKTFISLDTSLNPSDILTSKIEELKENSILEGDHDYNNNMEFLNQLEIKNDNES